MEDRQYPNLFFSNHIVNPVKLEAMYRRPTHVRESDSVMQSRFAQRSNGAIHFDQKFVTQTGLALLIPDCGVERVLFSERKLSDANSPVAP